MESLDAGAEAIRLDGPLTIRNTSHISEVLKTGLSENHSIIIEIDDGTEVDLSFVQLLISAQVSASSADKQVRLQHPPSGALRDVLEKGGFLDGDAAQLWDAGEIPQ